MKKKQRKGNEFWETIHDIRVMTAEHLNQNKSKVFKMHNNRKKVTYKVDIDAGKRYQSPLTVAEQH
jgi:hypothetical protein